eukprot:22163-Eustigmatos_ZCMA.PRE.1
MSRDSTSPRTHSAQMKLYVHLKAADHESSEESTTVVKVEVSLSMRLRGTVGHSRGTTSLVAASTRTKRRQWQIC